MPDLKITQFTQIITLDDADVLAIVDLTDNTTKKVTILQLKGIAPVQSVNGSTGAVTVQAVLVSGANIKTINSTSLLGSGNISVQAVLVSGINIKTINGNSILGGGDLVVTTTPAGTDGQVQYNNGGAFGGASALFYDDTNNFVGIGTLTPAKKLEVEDSNQCIATFTSTTTGGGITFSDSTTSDNEQVGVGAFGDLLCLRGGGNSGGTMQLSGTAIDCRFNFLKNFKASIQVLSINLTIDSSNEQTYSGQIIQVTGALTVTFDSSLGNGFNCTIIQMDANTTTIAVTGALNIRNRQGHTANNGQWSIVTILKNSTNLFLGGDTA